jgi:hypothetical protein
LGLTGTRPVEPASNLPAKRQGVSLGAGEDRDTDGGIKGKGYIEASAKIVQESA